MFRCCPVSTAAYHSSKIGERLQLLITKKEVEYDYVAIDASGLVGTALRLAKNVTTEQRRHKEVSRHVAQSLQQILKKIRCRRSLLIAMDGAETLAKAHKTRSSGMNRKLESRLMRLPGTPLMQAVEERIVRMIPDRQIFPGEVVFSGTCVDGCIEKKMSAWALDLSCGDAFNGSQQSMCLLGPSELFLNVLALTPYYNICSVVQNNTDMKHLQLYEILEWLGEDGRAKHGESATVARIRTDVVFFHILCFGASVSDLSPISGLSFAEVMDKYLGSLKSDAPHFLFEDGPNNSLVLNTQVLAHILSLSVRKSMPAKKDELADNYLESALQTHALLCLGKSCDPLFVPKEPLSPGGSISVLQLLVSLVALSDSPKRSARLMDLGNTEPSQPLARVAEQRLPLSAAEYTLLSHSLPAAAETAIQLFAGCAPLPDVGKRLTNMTVLESYREGRRMFSLVDPTKAHKCLYLSPSYCWLQNTKSKLWRFQYVDIGAVSEAMAIRGKRNAQEGIALKLSVSTDGPSRFNAHTVKWEPIEAFPCGGDGPCVASEVESSDSLGACTSSTPPAKISTDEVGGPNPAGHVDGRRGSINNKKVSLRVLTWNVMFDRYSGKPTPLGMPGIDWCSPKRYPVLAKCIMEEDADIVGMQEVEPQFWEFLSAQPWVKESYFFSCGSASPAITPWGVLMLVHRRLRVLNITHLNVPAWSGHTSLMPVATIQMAHSPVSVAAAHLLAPYTKSHEAARTGQDNALRLRIQKNITGDCITMGDFNDWPTNEFVMPSESQFVDCWPIVCPGHPGKTMDETNTFCRLKIEEIFFGRSDKVFLRSSRLRPVAAKLVGTRSVNEENGNTDAPAYLFPSDHYGVSMDFRVG